MNKAEITPRFFIKPGTAVIGTGEPIGIPPVSDDGRLRDRDRGGDRQARAARSPSRTPRLRRRLRVFNDISARHLNERRQPQARATATGSSTGWSASGATRFAVIGPYLVTADEIADVTALEMALRVNGELRQHSSAGEMIFTVPEAIAWISGFLTLEPGDLICMGTPGGVGETTQTYLPTRDLVEASARGWEPRPTGSSSLLQPPGQ